jgi:putative lipoic acid-binding regulatory protein
LSDRDDEAERARAIALLEANHQFPTAYSVSVIALNAVEVAERIATAAFSEVERTEGDHERKPSSGGKYVSHRITVRVESAEHVLVLYARLRAIDGVMTIL